MSLISLVCLLGGMVQGVAGLRMPTVAAGLPGRMMAPREAAALLVVPSVETNAWQLAAGLSSFFIGLLGPGLYLMLRPFLG